MGCAGHAEPGRSVWRLQVTDRRAIESQGVMRVVIVSCAFERANVDDPRRVRPVRSHRGPRLPAARVGRRLLGAGLCHGVGVSRRGLHRRRRRLAAARHAVDAGRRRPFPGVVLVHGSGPNDRDESIGPNKPFRDLAEGLASRGIAVLRYDKRTRTHAGRVARSATSPSKRKWSTMRLRP